MKDSSESLKQNRIFYETGRNPLLVHDAFNYHTRYRAIDRMIPPWSFLKIIKRNNGLENGAICILVLQYGPLKLKWIAKHFRYIQNQTFQDEMIKGPLKTWIHTHSFAPHEISGCILEDKIKYSLPYGLNRFNIFRNRINKTLIQMFGYRHRILQNDLNYRPTKGEQGKKNSN